MVSLYARTNENLASIVAGLDVCDEDYILCIGGSGDQSLALLEFAGRILCVEAEKGQVNYIRRLVELIGLADYKGFFDSRLGNPSYINEVSMDGSGRLSGKEIDFCLGEEEKATNYFNLERLTAIKEKLSRIEIRQGCIFETAQVEGSYNKVYLSNALGYDGHLGVDSSYREFSISEGLDVISRGLPSGGLVYISDGYEVSYDMFDVNGPPFEISGLQLDRALTARIQDNCWVPAVLRKL